MNLSHNNYGNGIFSKFQIFGIMLNRTVRESGIGFILPNLFTSFGKGDKRYMTFRYRLPGTLEKVLSMLSEQLLPTLDVTKISCYSKLTYNGFSSEPHSRLLLCYISLVS